MFKKFLAAVILTIAITGNAFAANTVPIFSFTLPASLSRGDIFNAVINIKSTAVSGVDYSADALEYKFTGAMVKITFPTADLEIVNKTQLAAAFDTAGLAIKNEKVDVATGTLTFDVEKKNVSTTLTPLSIPVDTATTFATITFKANRNSSGSETNGANCTITAPKADNTVIYQTGYANPADDATGNVTIKSDTDTPSDPTGDPAKRAITAKVNLEYPASGSHVTTLNALYWQQGDSGYTSFPGVQSTSDGAVSVEFDRTSGKKFRVGFKRASSLISGAEKEDAKIADFSGTVFNLVEGDLNSDNTIDGTDYTILTQLVNYAPASVVGLNKTGDVNNDGTVNKLDVYAFNNPINGTSTPRYLLEGYDIASAGTPANPLSVKLFGVDITSQTVNGRAYIAPDNSIVAVTKNDDGSYGISFTETTPKINMLQLALELTYDSPATFTLPEGWEVIGQQRTAYGITFAIGTQTAGGLSIAKGTTFASVKSESAPEVIYSGKTPSTMELATEGSVISYGFESTTNPAAETAQSGSSGSGCNAAGSAPAVMLLAALSGVFIFKKKH